MLLPALRCLLLLPLLLLLQFASEPQGSSGTLLGDALSNHAQLLEGAVWTGSGGTGIAAEGPDNRPQDTTGEVGYAVAENEEMQRFEELKEQKERLVESLMFPIRLMVVLLSWYLLAHIFIVIPAVEKQRDEACQQNDVPVPKDEAYKRLFGLPTGAADVVFVFATLIGYLLWMLGVAILRAPLNPYSRFKIRSLLQQLVQAVGNEKQVHPEDPQREPPQWEQPLQEQPENEVDAASTDRSR
ncbi:hypothetical protein EMWEY_00058940 [Eimeria maxima]|uniref:Transmembrane protein n=1 Tax=Eimeria maxima TaxID=5804 RepID=U6M6W1_EIMMA|nr:hypothetical protein EMWEY_00058940 [Eimeria maxima]CDJ59761.1 hypothetical protein EMWEY_00058940 [Eimeria maxima]